MVHPKKILRAVLSFCGALGAFLLLLASVDGVPKIYRSVLDWFFTSNVAFKPYSLVLVTVFIVCFCFLAYVFLFKTYSQNIELRRDNLNLRNQFEDSETLRRLDFVTGIPNHLQLSEDIKVINSLDDAAQFHLIFIDLVDFGALNREYGYPVADIIIRRFAQTVYSGMRRNERMYKFPIKEMGSVNDLWRRAYRKYNGGDEFVIIINGSEADAIGLCVRLQRDVLAKLNPEIQFEILKETKWKLRISAGVVRLYRKDTENEVIYRAHQAMRVCTQPGATLSIAWSSGLTAGDWPEKSWQRKVYADAVELFKK